MSRSYKKHPVVKDKNRGMQICASRKIRRKKYFEEIPNGMGYKKYFQSYDISDYAWYESFDEFLSSYRKWHPYSDETDEKLYRIWYKDYKSK